MHKRIRILDVPVDRVNYKQALSVFRQMMEGVCCELIVTPNAEIVLHATKDQAFKRIMEEARLVIPDGIGLVYASRLIGEPLSERVTGIDFFEKIVAELAKTGQSVFFLGSKPGVAEKAAAKMQEKYPGLVVAGARDGYFREEDEEELVRHINESGAGFLCVALGSPKQEEFMYKHKDRFQVKAAIGAGGSLDVLAGELSRAPEFYRKHGLEWLYRFKQQPGRYKRMFRLPVFILKVWLDCLPDKENNMQPDLQKIADAAREIRIDIIRAIHAAASGHPGGSLSAADILAVLYFHQMNIDPNDPQKEDRDKFVLSKGHAAPVLYGALAERGYFEKEKVLELRKTGSIMQGHPDMKKIPGVEMSTGSLGQGFSASVGMALGHKLDKSKARVYVLLGDGELQEGIIWEAAMSAAHYKLNNLTAILDYNGLQIDGKNDDVMTVRPVDDKFRSFGWHVIVIDGHNYEEIIKALEEAAEIKDKPTMVIANTVKGKGVSFMENQAGWHGKAPDEQQAKQAVEELGGVW